MTDERTQVEIHANLDESVIHGTLRNCDLVPAFLDVIRDTAEYAQFMLHLPSVVTDPSASENDERWENEEMIYFVEELFDVLDSYAPDGYYFGSHPGDGSDFGFWKTENNFDLP